jgi:hypothetical protein
MTDSLSEISPRKICTSCQHEIVSRVAEGNRMPALVNAPLVPLGVEPRQ